jgi:Fuc2NAc and GlcNAc transferase
MVTLVCLALSTVLCGLYIPLARRWQILDAPNERSSHDSATAHGGGVPLLLSFYVGISLTAPWNSDFIWLVIMSLCLLLLGVADDLRGLPARLRFFLYALVAISTAATLLAGSVEFLSPVGLALLLATAFVILWAINLYNFMDGIDGMAATQCVLACTGVALLVEAGDYALFCGLLAACQLGFLVWNWSPARVFMGDAGSIPTGFLLAGLGLYGAINGLLPVGCWLVLLAVFITDASWTLVWRVITRQPFTQAHRLHAYQRLSRHWGSHRSVVLLLLGLFVFWLFPIAWLVQEWPVYTVIFVTLAYIPLLFGMAKMSRLT